MRLFFKLFGAPVLSAEDGHIYRFPTRKSEALLAYLVAQAGDPVSRDALSDLLWPYSAEEQARASLRQELTVLRRVLGPEHAKIVVAHADRIQVDVSRVAADIWQQSHHSASRTDTADALRLLATYSAPFLDTFRLRSQPFTDWMQSTRQGLETQIMAIGQAALQSAQKAADQETITTLALHLTRIDPTCEPAHRALIEQFLRAGDVSAAERQFRLCEDALKTHLDVEVSPLTRDLMQQGAQPALAPVAAAATKPAPRSKQRRFLAALSVQFDLKLHDPEEYDSVVQSHVQKVRDRITAKGGATLPAIGGNVLAYFGYPVGHDTDPHTAVLTAFDILKSFAADGNDISTLKIGISCGQALIADTPADAESNPTITGAVLAGCENIARQTHAGTVAIDRQMEKLLPSGLELIPLPGTPNAKIVVAHDGQLIRSDQLVFPESAYPMVGRDAQFDHLLGLLDLVKSGQGAVAAILGNPGEGKSRLVQEVAQASEALGFECKLFQGNKSQQQSTLSPVLDELRRAGVGERDDDAQSALVDWLTQLSPELALAAPYFSSLLGRKVNEPKDLADEVKASALNIFAAQVANRGRPKLLIFEDIQWFDPSTCAAISRLTDVVNDVPFLAVMVSRKDEMPDIVNHPFVQKIELSPLQPQHAQVLLHGLLKDSGAPDPMLSNVLKRAEGNPLFLEEFAKTIKFQQQGTTRQALEIMSGISTRDDDRQVDTPLRLVPLLLSRIDAIPGAIQILRFASLFGRSFSRAQIDRLVPGFGTDENMMARLEEAGILFVQRRGEDESYIFKHALISEAIYETIPKTDRAGMHLEVAGVLVSDEQRSDLSVIARHYKQAKADELAAEYFEKSGDIAARISANAEAISEYGEAITLIAALASSTANLRKELALNRKIAAQMIALRGIPTQEVTAF